MFVFLLCFGLVAAQQCQVPTPVCIPATSFHPFDLPKEGTPLQLQPHNAAPFQSDHLFKSQPAPFQPLRLNIAGADVPFQMSTDADRERHQELQKLDAFLQETLPVLFSPSVNCQTLSETECVEQEGCSWCSWPFGACHTTDMSDLLPTQDWCVIGGEPLSFPDEPIVICGDVWFDEC